VQGIKSTAKKLDDGGWELNGQKMWVTGDLLPWGGDNIRQVDLAGSEVYLSSA
jgi:hypothetical protein